MGLADREVNWSPFKVVWTHEGSTQRSDCGTANFSLGRLKHRCQLKQSQAYLDWLPCNNPPSVAIFLRLWVKTRLVRVKPNLECAEKCAQGRGPLSKTSLLAVALAFLPPQQPPAAK